MNLLARRQEIKQANRQKVYEIMRAQAIKRKTVIRVAIGVTILKVMKGTLKEQKRRKDEAKYMADIFWLSLKWRSKLLTSLKRKGPNMRHRTGKTIV